MHSMLQALALLQNSLKKLAVNYVFPALLRAKEFFRESILVPSLRQNFSLSTFKILMMLQNRKGSAW